MKKFLVTVANKHHTAPSGIHKVFLDVEAETPKEAQEKALKQAMEEHGPTYKHVNRCVVQTAAPRLLMKRFDI